MAEREEGWATIPTFEANHYVFRGGRPACGIDLHSRVLSRLQPQQHRRKCENCLRNLRRTKTLKPEDARQ